MKITSITITETMNNRRQLADVSIVKANEGLH